MMSSQITASNERPAAFASEDDRDDRLKQMAQRFSGSVRTPILRTPGDYGLDFETITFPALDDVPIEGWFVPCAGSRKLLIVNHPRWFNRYGCPAHLEPWRSVGNWADPGNAYEVNYVPDIRILHDQGYNVLTYDERNFGLTSAANGGITTAGRFESRDVIGSLRYARDRDDLRDMAIGLFSRCNGANATMFAMHDQPHWFEDIRCFVACQPLSVGSVAKRRLEKDGLADEIDKMEQEIRLLTSLSFAEMSPVNWAPSITTPTFLYQVHDDKMTYPDDVQAMFDALPAATEKKLHWVHGTTARWDGYMEFQRRPEPMLDWFAKFMA